MRVINPPLKFIAFRQRPQEPQERSAELNALSAAAMDG